MSRRPSGRGGFPGKRQRPCKTTRPRSPRSPSSRPVYCRPAGSPWSTRRETSGTNFASAGARLPLHPVRPSLQPHDRARFPPGADSAKPRCATTRNGGREPTIPAEEVETFTARSDTAPPWAASRRPPTAANRPRTYLPLFETLNWAARLIDNLGHPDVTTAQGLRWARNAVQLHWAKALEPREVHAPRPIVAGERSEIIRDTVALDWFWLPLERMPKPRASKHEPEQREAYVARFAEAAQGPRSLSNGASPPSAAAAPISARPTVWHHAALYRAATPARQRVRMRGLEPPRGFPHTALNRARLPIPPHPRGRTV